MKYSPKDEFKNAWDSPLAPILVFLMFVAGVAILAGALDTMQLFNTI